METKGKRAVVGGIGRFDIYTLWGFLGGTSGKNPPANAVDIRDSRIESRVRSLDQGDPLGEVMATCSSILAWRIPWPEKLGKLQSMGSQRVRHN